MTASNTLIIGIRPVKEENETHQIIVEISVMSVWDFTRLFLLLKIKYFAVLTQDFLYIDSKPGSGYSFLNIAQKYADLNLG